MFAVVVEKKQSDNFNNPIARPDQGHRYTLLEVPGRTCPGRRSNPGLPCGSTLEKSHLDSLYAGYSEPLLMMRLALKQQPLHGSSVQVKSTWTTECRREVFIIADCVNRKEEEFLSCILEGIKDIRRALRDSCHEWRLTNYKVVNDALS
jgi:hypothetical protein